MVGLVTRLTKTQGDPTHIESRGSWSKEPTSIHEVESKVMTDVVGNRNRQSNVGFVETTTSWSGEGCKAWGVKTKLVRFHHRPRQTKSGMQDDRCE